ncbi:MAG: tetratricopeptide repeat protein [Acidimicrobiia bacterium]|nr:tetratricopeptide repeat protein [Acidimicrobiia bacterium]
MGFVALPLILGAVVFAVVAASKRTQRIHDAWGRAAEKLGLRQTGAKWSFPSMEGTISQLHVKVEVYSTGSKNKTYWTKYIARFPQKGMAISLKRQSGLSRVTKFFGATDTEIGDVQFDDAFMIKEESAQHAAQYLTLSRRTLLLKLFSLYRDVELTPNKLKVVRRGYEDNVDALVTHTRRVVSAARVLAGVSESEPRMRESLERRLAGDMAMAAERLRAEPVPPEDVDTPLLEAELLAESGRLVEAESVLTSLSRELPADEEVAGLRRAIGRMKPNEPAAETSDVDMQELLDDLFVSNRLSFETAEVFDEHYLGRSVTWTGQFKSARDVPNDLDFQAGAGTKMVVAIAEVEHDLYGVSEVDAIVHVPTGSAQGLSRGDRVAFTGTLLKADSMMRNVFVEKARITS